MRPCLRGLASCACAARSRALARSCSRVLALSLCLVWSHTIAPPGLPRWPWPRLTLVSCTHVSLLLSSPRQQASLVCRPSLLSRFCFFSFCRLFKAALAELLIFLTFCRPFSGLISGSCSLVFVSRFYFLNLFSGLSSPVFLSLKFSGRIFSGFIFPDNFFGFYSSASEFRSSSCRLRFSLRISSIAAHCS